MFILRLATVFVLLLGTAGAQQFTITPAPRTTGPAPVNITATTTQLTVAQLGGIISTSGSSVVTLVLPAAASVPVGQTTWLEADGAGGMNVAVPSGGWLGIPVAGTTVTLLQYGSGAAWSDGTTWHMTGVTPGL